METKDIIAISISSLAFLLSLAATAISLVRSKYEKQRTIKKEITDTLGKLFQQALKTPSYIVKSQKKTHPIIKRYPAY